MRLLRFARNDTNVDFLRNHQLWLGRKKLCLFPSGFDRPSVNGSQIPEFGIAGNEHAEDLVAFRERELVYERLAGSGRDLEKPDIGRLQPHGPGDKPHGGGSDDTVVL